MRNDVTPNSAKLSHDMFSVGPRWSFIGDNKGRLRRKIGMICSVKPVPVEDLCVVQKEEFSITCYVFEMYTWRKAKHIHKRQTHILVREDVTKGLLPQVFGWKKYLVVSLKGSGAKANGLAVNHQS
jgi:hypothetical protein